MYIHVHSYINTPTRSLVFALLGRKAPFTHSLQTWCGRTSWNVSYLGFFVCLNKTFNKAFIRSPGRSPWELMISCSVRRPSVVRPSSSTFSFKRLLLKNH